MKHIELYYRKKRRKIFESKKFSKISKSYPQAVDNSKVKPTRRQIQYSQEKLLGLTISSVMVYHARGRVSSKARYEAILDIRT